MSHIVMSHIVMSHIASHGGGHDTMTKQQQQQQDHFATPAPSRNLLDDFDFNQPPLTPLTPPGADEPFALSEEMRVPIWYPCVACHATGRMLTGVPTTQCGVCRRVWTADEIAAHLRHNWRGHLPCGDKSEAGVIVYSYPECPVCERGSGWRVRLVALGDALDWLETLYATISQQTTARQRSAAR